MGLNLVTGGSGYFGTLLVRRLVEAGERVRIFDVNRPDECPQGVEVVVGDVGDQAAVRAAAEGVSVVHHNVALVPLVKDVDRFWRVNYDGTRNVLTAAKASGVDKVVHTSSSAVFGVPEKNPVDDSVKPRPREAYGEAKLAAERLCHDFATDGLDVTIVRPRTIMGHGRLGIMQLVFEWVRCGDDVPVLGGGDNLYQFVHADDLASACLKAAARPGPSTYNVGAAQFGTMAQTLRGLIDHAGTDSRIVSLPMTPATWAMNITSRLRVSPLGAYHALMYGRSMYFDIERTRRELDWEPRFGNIEMFCHSYDWYLAHRDEVLRRTTATSPHRAPVAPGILSLVRYVLRWAPEVSA